MSPDSVKAVPSIPKPQHCRPELQPHSTAAEIRSFSKRKLEDFRNTLPLLLFDIVACTEPNSFHLSQTYEIHWYKSCGSESFYVRWFDSCGGPNENYPRTQKVNLYNRGIIDTSIIVSPGKPLSLTFFRVIFLRWNYVAEIKRCSSIKSRNSDPQVNRLVLPPHLKVPGIRFSLQARRSASADVAVVAQHFDTTSPELEL